MPVAELYRSFARECFRWADKAAQDEFRRTCLEMAKTWTQLAEKGAGDDTPDCWPMILCIQCGERMQSSEPKPVRSSGLHEVSCVCSSCGIATTRFVLAPRDSASFSLG